MRRRGIAVGVGRLDHVSRWISQISCLFGEWSEWREGASSRDRMRKGGLGFERTKLVLGGVALEDGEDYQGGGGEEG